MPAEHSSLKLRDPLGLRKGRSLEDIVHEEISAKAYKHDLRVAQLELLKSLGCEAGQGHLFAPSLEPSDFAKQFLGELGPG